MIKLYVIQSLKNKKYYTLGTLNSDGGFLTNNIREAYYSDNKKTIEDVIYRLIDEDCIIIKLYLSKKEV